MTGPSLQRTAAASAALHLSFLLLVLFVMQKSNAITMPSPYVVSLAGPSALSAGKPLDIEAARQTIEETGAAPATTFEKERAEKRIKELEQRADRISEIEEKKKIEKIVRLRKLISVGGHDVVKDAAARPGQAGQAAGRPGTAEESYYAQITRVIRSEWTYPDSGERNLEAIVSIQIARDGTMTVRSVEKSSGNALFDRSVLRAIAKASPVAPPPQEMEIGVRFYP